MAGRARHTTAASSPNVPTMEIILAALLAGLVATPHCAGMCGGFATACARPRTGLFAWHSGRATTYAVIGAVGGAAGRLLPGPTWLPGVIATALLVWFAAGLAGLVRPVAPRLTMLSRVTSRVAGRQSGAARYAFGVLTGMLPCGMVYAAASMAVASGSAMTGAAVMVAFGAATVPGLTLVSMSLQRLAARSIWSRRALAVLVLGLGLWSVGVRTGVTGSHPDHAGHGKHDVSDVLDGSDGIPDAAGMDADDPGRSPLLKHGPRGPRH